MSLSRPLSSLFTAAPSSSFASTLTRSLLALWPKALGSVTGAWLLWKLWRLMCPPVPAHLRHLPTLTTFQQMRSMAMSPPKRYQYIRKILGEVPFYTHNFIGKWMVMVQDIELARKVLSRVDVFPKATVEETFGKESLNNKLLGHSIVFANGEEWRRHRKVANPAFKKNFDVEIFGECGKTLIQLWEKLDKSQTVNIHDWMQRITLQALGKVIFNVDFDAFKSDDENELVRIYHETSEILSNPIFFLSPMLGGILYPRLARSLNKFDKLLGEIIDNRRKDVMEDARKGHVFNDLISLMIQAEESEAADGPKLSREELKRNAFIFFIAGHDTTANALSCALYNFAKYPEFQDRARAETIDVMGPLHPDDPYKVPTFDEQKRLHFLTAFIMETLRLYPSAPLIPFRNVVKPVTLGDLQLHEGDVVEISVYDINRAPRAWKDTEKFDPMRFYQQNSGDQEQISEVAGTGQNQISWLPFGGGSRQCLGMTMSLIESRVILAQLLRFYRFYIPENQEPSFKTGFILNPGNSIGLRVERI